MGVSFTAGLGLLYLNWRRDQFSGSFSVNMPSDDGWTAICLYGWAVGMALTLIFSSLTTKVQNRLIMIVVLALYLIASGVVRRQSLRHMRRREAFSHHPSWNDSLPVSRNDVPHPGRPAPDDLANRIEQLLVDATRATREAANNPPRG